MLTGTHEESPERPLRRYWPHEFTKRRRFNSQAENRPYLEWLSVESFDDSEEENDDSDHSIDVEDDASEWISDQPTYDEEEDGANNQSNVRRFMKGVAGEEDTLSYPDQVEVVASFCEQDCNKGVKTNTVGRDTKSVVLLHDRTTSAASKSGTFHVKQGHRCLPYLGPLTAQQLREELSKKVVYILSSH
jgi:hypothetical protein